MSVAKVLRLEDYRGKRTQRERLSAALYGVDPLRASIFGHLTDVSELCGADRVATVWVDEYGPGSVHPHVVLDHLTDRPRRVFSSEPLRRAWEVGLPGVIDERSEPHSTLPATFAISLGSDGTRAWFLVAESSGGRPLLSSGVRDRLMFLAGECAAVLLHQELDRVLAGDDEAEGGGFAGWAILKDMEGREEDDEGGRRIAQRFVVGRVARMLADEGFVESPDRLEEQVRRARSELLASPDHDDEEALLWHRTLDVLETAQLGELAHVLVSLGEAVERIHHAHGALELYSCAYEAATAASLARPAAEAAWYSARLLRRRASWEDARTRYECAQAIADAAGLEDVSVHSLVGLALMKRDMGNIPGARSDLDRALALARSGGDRDALGVVHHALLGLEQIAGNLAEGLEHGWLAVDTYESPERRTQCLASLAAALMEFGDRSAAEDAWELVALMSSDAHYEVYAHDALAHLAALRGDERAFGRHAARCDSLDWEAGAPSVKAEILQYRGLSYRALGRLDLAEAWLSRAVAFAEEHGFNRVLFQAEEALGSLAARATTPAESLTPVAPRELRDGLRSLRREMSGSGA